MAKSTLLVAANDASTEDKARADYTCDGVADDVQINNAITTLQAGKGGAVLLTPGTFTLAARVLIAGAGLVDTEQVICLFGSGESNTILDATAVTTSGVHLTGSCKAHLANFRVLVDGATHGISSAGTLTAAAGYRAFWHSSFKNLTVIGDFAAHTGYGFHFGTPFRSVFENLEANGVGNGMRMYSEDNGFNPGDCVISRCFMDTVANNGFGYKIESTKVDGNINQMEFIMCEAIASGTGCTGLYMGGTGPVTHIKWHGINLEQFDKHVDFAYADGCTVDGNYWELRGATGLSGIVFGTNTVNCSIEKVGFWYFGTASNMFSRVGGTATQPNTAKEIALFCDGAAAGLGYTGPANTAGTDILLRKRISNGGGTSPGTNVLVPPGSGASF